MGITVYTCSDDFPARLSEVLSGAGYQVTDTPPRKPNQLGIVLKRPFGCQVSDGRRILHIAGSEEKDGRLYFVIVPVWSWNPRKIFGQRQFYHSVERVLLKSGANYVTEREMAT